MVKPYRLKYPMVVKTILESINVWGCYNSIRKRIPMCNDADGKEIPPHICVGPWLE